MEILAQTADIDIWRHPITLLVVAAVLGAIGTAVGFALRQIITSQRLQDIKLGDLSTALAVRNAIDENEEAHTEQRWQRVETDVAGLRSDIGALHKRLDDVLGRLTAGNPEVRP